MTKKINKKDIVCYNCGKIGIAKLVSKLIDETKSIPNPKMPGKLIRKKTGKKKIIWVWEAKGFQQLGVDSFLCSSCSRHRCRRCHILLGDRKCEVCGEYHGAFYKDHPKYCKQCWDEIEASKKS